MTFSQCFFNRPKVTERIKKFCFRFSRRRLSELSLMYYNTSMSIIVSEDASAFGLGATISHHFPDATEKAIMCASRTLSLAHSAYFWVMNSKFSVGAPNILFEQTPCHDLSVNILRLRKIWLSPPFRQKTTRTFT